MRKEKLAELLITIACTILAPVTAIVLLVLIGTGLLKDQ